MEVVKIEAGKFYTDGTSEFIVKKIVARIMNGEVFATIITSTVGQDDSIPYRVGRDDAVLKTWQYA